MASFQAIAEEAKRLSNERIADAESRVQAKIQDNLARFQCQVSELRDLVIELLQEAVEDLEKTGVRAHLVDNFDTPASRYNMPPARIEFWCSGQGRLIKSARYQAPESEKATFEVGEDGAFMRYGRSVERLELRNDPRHGVTVALKKVVESYYLSVERIEDQLRM